MGGTWYWNRYPGCMLIVLLYICPTWRRRGTFLKGMHAPEILLQSKKIAQKYGLYENILLQTKVTSISWEEQYNRRRIKTNRNDNFTTTFVE